MMEDFDGRNLLADEMGLGKTLQTLWTLRRNPDWLPAVVVCPASVKYNWKHESEVNAEMRVTVCEGRTAPRFNKFDFSFMSPITIINYDILKFWVSYFKQMGVKTLIFDECQFLQNMATDRWIAAKALSQFVKHVIALSGTPFTNRPYELFSVLNLIWPWEFNSVAKYARVYCDPKWGRWGWDYSGASNLDHLHERLKNLGMIRRLKKNVLPNLKEGVRRVEVCELTDMEEYREAKNNFLGWLKDNNPSKVNAASKAEKLVQVGYLMRLCGRLKMKPVVEWANRFLEETDEKLVMFAHHLKAIDVLKRRLQAQSVCIVGGVDSKLRHAAVQQFQKDPNIRVCIGSDAMITGVTLTAAQTLGFAEFFWRPADHTQAEKRIDRIGQQGTPWFHYFVAAGTIEERVCELLTEKQKNISAVLDGGPQAEDLNILEILLEELEMEV